MRIFSQHFDAENNAKAHDGVTLKALPYKLFSHNHLMTPVLQKYFGGIYALEYRSEEDDIHYTRYSRVYQKESNILLLNAKLIITKRALPASLIKALSSSHLPFGQLLANHGINTTIQNRILFHTCTPKNNNVIRHGSRHNIVNICNQEKLCAVEELLAPEQKLVAAHYSNKRSLV